MAESKRPLIQFLGTGAGDFYDANDKDGHLGGRNIRHAPSLFITPDIVVDFSSDGQLKGFAIPKEFVRHLLITHGHYDHFRPVAIQHFAATLPHPLAVYGSRTVKDALGFAAEYSWNRSEKLFETNDRSSNVERHAVEIGESFFLGEVQVTPVLANHCIDKTNEILEQLALNYVFERNGRTLFYGLDSSYVLPGTSEILSTFQFDIAVFDATFGHLEIDPAISGHMNYEMLDETIARFREAELFREKAVIVASHVSQPSYDESVDELYEKSITLAYDGMTLEF